MIGNSPNRKPQGLVDAKPQGASATTGIGVKDNANGELKQSHARYDKGMEIYKEGRVQLTPSGLFKVSERFYVDTEKMHCDCPDHKTRKEACKHIFAALLFVKNRNRTVIQDLDGFTWVDEVRDTDTKDIDTPNKPQEAPTKPFDRQATITRLAVLNTATEILKTHSKPIEPETVISIASHLEKWALGN